MQISRGPKKLGSGQLKIEIKMDNVIHRVLYLFKVPSSYLSYVSSGQTWCKMWKIKRKVERVSFTGDYLGMFPPVHTMNHENQVSINAMFEMGVIFLQLFLNPATILNMTDCHVSVWFSLQITYIQEWVYSTYGCAVIWSKHTDIWYISRHKAPKCLLLSTIMIDYYNTINA